MSGSANDSMDLSQFHGVFFDEAAEHLERMEGLLLGIDIEAADDETLNAIFRAAHSIKGGAATFGFKDITGLTHEMETVFDKVRKGDMALSSDLVDVFLLSGDMLKALLAHHRGDGEACADYEVEALCVRLRAFLDDHHGGVADGIAALAAAAALELVLGPFDDKFTPTNADEVLRDLADFGKITPNEHAPADCRSVQIVTDVSVSDMADTLAFMVDPDKVQVRRVDGREAAEPAPQVAAQQPAQATAPVTTEAAPVAAAASTAAESDDDGFGLFVDAAVLPVNQKPVHVAHAAATPAAAPGAAAPATTAQENVKALRPARPAAVSNDAHSIRVDIEKVDQLINLVGELVITQAMLAQTASTADPVLYEKLLNGMAQLQRNTRDLQESAMSIRMMPMSFVFSRFPRVVRDTAAKLGKEVELQTIGEGTELDKGLIERIVDPLTHLVRNSLDHGIEPPDERVARGKVRKGSITLRAYHQGGAIIIEVADDGRGLRRDKILEKAKERGLPVSDAMSDQEVWALIFEAGFSTAEVVTDVSGRGVGMDVVRRNIQELGGRIEIDSVRDIGTRISIRLPLTLAILDGMSVRVGEEMFILPLNAVKESLQPQTGSIQTISGQGRVISVRGEYVPVLALAEAFGMRGERKRFEDGILVIVEGEDGKTALFVDDLVGQHQVVIKSLETNYRKVAGLSGATIMGDGRVAMILDIAHLVGLAHSRLDKAA